jgi:hypothetical protein
MSRVATLEIMWQTDLGSAKAKYDEFKRYVESNPPRINFAPVGDGSRVVPTFGGQSMNVAGPPPGAAPMLTSGGAFAGSITGTSPSSIPGSGFAGSAYDRFSFAGTQFGGPGNTLGLYGGGGYAPTIAVAGMAAPAGSPLANALANYQNLNPPTNATIAGLLPPGAGAPVGAGGGGYAGGSARRWAMATAAIVYGVDQALTPSVQRNLRSVLAEASTLDEQLASAESEAQGEYGNPLRFYAQKGISQVPGWTALGFSDPEEDLRATREGRRTRRLTMDADKLRDETRRMRSDTGAIGLEGPARDLYEANAEYDRKKLELDRTKRTYAGFGGPAAQGAIDAANDQLQAAGAARAATGANLLDVMGRAATHLAGQGRVSALAGAGRTYAAGLEELQNATDEAYQKADRETAGMNAADRSRYLGAVAGAGMGKERAYAADAERAATMGVTETFYTGEATRQARQGWDRNAQLSALDAEFLPMYDKNGKVVGFQGLDPSAPHAAQLLRNKLTLYEQKVLDIDADVSRDEITRGGRISSLAAAMSYHPLDAQLISLQAQRAAQVYGLDTSSQRYKDVMSEFDLRDESARRKYRWDTRSIDAGLSAERSALGSAMRREPGEAQEAYGIGAQGLQTAQDLIRSGHIIGGVNSYENSLAQLRLLRQNYFDNLRGEQVDLNLIATQGGRQSEDPQAVINAIKEAEQNLINGIKEALKEAVDSGA